MALPAIVWRNPDTVSRRRVWNRAKRDDGRSLYLVVESAPEEQNEWKGLPNLEIIQGGASAAIQQVAEKQSLSTGA